MLEAANARPRFTISLKRSTQNLQLSTSLLADYPIFAPEVEVKSGVRQQLKRQQLQDLKQSLEYHSNECSTSIWK